MPLTYQAFLNSLMGSLGCDRIAASTRRRLAQITLASWSFSDKQLTVEQVEDRHGAKLTGLMHEFVRRAIESLAGIHSTDSSFDKDLWNYSEIAHDIEEQRDVEAGHRNHPSRAVDSDSELPYAEASM